MKLKPEDMIAPPCECGECRQAGVSGLEQRRDPPSGRMLHGYELKRWYEARAKFLELKGQVAPKSMDFTSAGKTPKQSTRFGSR